MSHGIRQNLNCIQASNALKKRSDIIFIFFFGFWLLDTLPQTLISPLLRLLPSFYFPLSIVSCQPVCCEDLEDYLPPLMRQRGLMVADLISF